MWIACVVTGTYSTDVCLDLANTSDGEASRLWRDMPLVAQVLPNYQCKHGYQATMVSVSVVYRMHLMAIPTTLNDAACSYCKIAS